MSAIRAVESVKGVNVVDVNTSDDSVRHPHSEVTASASRCGRLPIPRG